MQKLVIDSSSIISISDKCLIGLLKALARKKFTFYLPEAVYIESVVNPLKIKRFELNAIRIKDAIGEGLLTVVKKDGKLEHLTKELVAITNCISFTGKECLRLIHRGEAETLALTKLLNAGTLVIDERTTRMLIENPIKLNSFLQARYQKKFSIDKNKLGKFKKFVGGLKIIRSVELVALSYELGCFEPELERTKQALEAAMYAVKYAGCAVSSEEIKEYLKGIE